MMNFILLCLVNIICAFFIVLCGREALTPSSTLACIAWWIGVYFMLELHVRLINYLREF